MDLTHWHALPSDAMDSNEDVEQGRSCIRPQALAGVSLQGQEPPLKRVCLAGACPNLRLQLRAQTDAVHAQLMRAQLMCDEHHGSLEAVRRSLMGAQLRCDEHHGSREAALRTLQQAIPRLEAELRTVLQANLRLEAEQAELRKTDIADEVQLA